VEPGGAGRDESDAREERAVRGPQRRLDSGSASGEQVDQPGRAEEEEREVRDDVPEVWDAEDRSAVREGVVTRVLRDRGVETDRNRRADADSREEEEAPVSAERRQCIPGTT
jgi:hypothetical protein